MNRKYSHLDALLSKLLNQDSFKENVIVDTTVPKTNNVNENYYHLNLSNGILNCKTLRHVFVSTITRSTSLLKRTKPSTKVIQHSQLSVGNFQ
ncbi:unnamed protein product [Trichobilharzia szidati]|nr:unnamed protein product [Trichobilharzia szidati]